jgi:hypothetical protein
MADKIFKLFFKKSNNNFANKKLMSKIINSNNPELVWEHNNKALSSHNDNGIVPFQLFDKESKK